MTEPLLRILQARGEQITVAALPRVAPVYRAMASVSAVIELPFVRGQLQFKERKKLAKQLLGRFDIAYVLPNSLKSALLPAMAGIPQRVGYTGEMRMGLLTHRLKNPSKKHRAAMVAHYAALAQEPELVPGQPQLQVDLAAADVTLAGLGLQPGNYYVFAPGAEYGPAKRWPAPHFALLAQALNRPVLLLGSSQEAVLCEEIATLTHLTHPGLCRNLAGKTSLEQAMQVIAATKSIVSNDSGLMHIAAALGVPQVAIFGSSSPEHTPPLNSQAQVMWLKQDANYLPALDCAPCFARECRFPEGAGHLRCLRDITPARVAAVLLR